MNGRVCAKIHLSLIVITETNFLGQIDETENFLNPYLCSFKSLVPFSLLKMSD